MECSYFDADQCNSCTLIQMPYDEQLRMMSHDVAAAIGCNEQQLPVVPSAQEGFRNKAKLGVSGSVQNPKLGLVDRFGTEQDLSHCPLYPPAMQQVFAQLKTFITRANLVPYSIAHRQGELKYVVVTMSPEHRVMVRFVLRSTEAVPRIKKHLPALLHETPQISVVSVNLQPEHKAVIEGDQEIILTDQQTLAMRLDNLTLHLRPHSFFQTNTALAQELYRRATALAAQRRPRIVWDLYCGVGGFALHIAPHVDTVIGVEVSANAIASARQSALEQGLTNTAFYVQDATEYAACALSGNQTALPDLVIVNPPRRGLGEELARTLKQMAPTTVIYSSCNATSLARDLEVLDNYEIDYATVLDMFPHTRHNEVLVRLVRK